MKAGDPVTVRVGRGGVQRGTVTQVLPDGRFQWKNQNNHLRTSSPSDLTQGPERPIELSAYMAQWSDDPEEQ